MPLSKEYSLRPKQIQIIEKCLKKRKACIKMIMGDGKTLTSCELGLKILEEYSKENNVIESIKPTEPILVITSKTLVLATWKDEIEKFYKNTVEYEILLSINENYKPQPNVKIIVTTPQVLFKCYKFNNISSKFITKEIVNVNKYLKTEKTVYNRPDKPFLNNDKPF